MVARGMPRWRQLASRLEQEILSGARAPGSQLPSLTAQQAEGVSQTTTLHAYRELVSRGLAVAVHGSGTFVADPVPEVAAEPTIGELHIRLRAVEERLAQLEKTRR